MAYMHIKSCMTNGVGGALAIVAEHVTRCSFLVWTLGSIGVTCIDSGNRQ